MSEQGQGRSRKFPLPLDRVGSTPRRLVRDAAPPPAGKPPVARAYPPGRPPPVPRAEITPAAGLGLDSDAVRRRMVQRLRAGGLAHEAVLGALGTVPRHRFVDGGLVNQAYEDTSLPIGFGQTISKPSVVGRMVALLCEGANAARGGGLGKVLEIGTGCGYQAAVLACLSRQVFSVERLKPLHDQAREHLAALRDHRIRLVYGDGRLGHPPNAPYDSIIAAAGGDALPDAWLQQLAPGGRLVAPRADAASGRQVLVTVDRTRDGFVHRTHEAVLFVPLKSGLD